MKINHSPTPWELREGQTRRLGYLIVSKPVNEAVIETIPSNRTDIDDKATAEFIIRAVNSFDDLLKASKQFLDQIGEEQRNRGLTNYGEGFITRFDQLRMAINKAEGKLK